jgi:endoglycosylceramidase
VIDPNRPPAGDNVKQAKLEVLSEPYPQLVAGTPSSYGFDPASGRFELTYSTKGPTGRNFARRHRKRAKHKRSRAARKSRQTQIFLGHQHYPKGYRVAVDGGGIASKPGASLLKVLACPGRRSVSVTVSPASAGSRSHGDCEVTRRGKRRR